jgi:hypothetical protein
MEENNEQQLSPELKDIINRINAFNITNPEAVFLFAFVGYKKSDEKCEECGENCDCVDENKFLFGGHGDLQTLRQLNNDLREMMEDSQEDGFVSF